MRLRRFFEFTKAHIAQDWFLLVVFCGSVLYSERISFEKCKKIIKRAACCGLL